MPARKRTIEEVEAEVAPPEPTPPMLLRLRNLWEFASLTQYIYLFGEAVKIDKDIDIDLLERECMKPTASPVLSQIGLALLKNVSSHRGLTPEIFNEYARRQYLAKAPKRNPFGEDEEPNKFTDFDIVQKIRVLHQLSVWTLNNPDRIRQHYSDGIYDQTSWRIEETGWDKSDRSYFVLDDNRLYRMTKPQVREPARANSNPKPKPIFKRAKGSRSSKRQKLANGDAHESQSEDDVLDESVLTQSAEAEDNGLGGAKWECIAITLDEYKRFLDTIRKSKDADERALLRRISDDVLPELERYAAAKERKMAQQRRDLLNMQKLATAKRSSRLAGKTEKMREQHEAEEAERKNREELAMAHREQEKQRLREAARESRIQTREQRLRERETKRILHEEELRKLEEQEARSDSGDARISERHRKFEMEKQRQELEKWSEAEDEWYFDCAVCGRHGKNLDDGTHSIACEKCNVWQHSTCHGIKEDEAERDDFHFICASCKVPMQLRIRSSGGIKPLHTSAIATQNHDGVQKHTNLAEETNASIDATATSRASGRSPGQPPLYNWSTAQKISTGTPSPQANGHHYPQMASYQQIHTSASPNPFTNGYPPPTSFSSPLVGVNRNESFKNNLPPREYDLSSPPQHSQSPQKSQTHSGYNPHYNDFGKQRQYFNGKHAPSTTRRPTSRGSIDDSISPETQQQQQQQQQPTLPSSHSKPTQPYQPPGATPHTSFQSQTPAPHISASPTPSLAATQGSTSVRFSPTASRSMSSMNAYVPQTNQPTLAACSPTKQASPPPSQGNLQTHHRYPANTQNVPVKMPAPPLSSPKTAVAGTNAHIPNLQSSSPNITDRNAGISPVKHDLPPSSPPPEHGLSIGAPVIAANVDAPPASSSDHASRNLPLGHGPFTSPPDLQPTVYAENGKVAPPVKKSVGGLRYD